MISELLDEIVAYFQYLQSHHGDYVAFHNWRIPLDGYMRKLAPYNINSNPFCLLVKANPDVWNACIDRQGKVVAHCSGGAFCGTCYAGVGEFVFPIRDLDGTVLGFISLSGYRIHEREAMGKLRMFSHQFSFSFSELQQTYQHTMRSVPQNKEELHARIAPLCNMFVLLHHALQGIPEQYMQTHRKSSILGHAIVYIRKNYTADPKAEDIARYCHCSVSTLSHLFKKETGMSIPEYVRMLRIENGKRLLLDTDLSVEQISDSLGFCNANYFASLFRKSTGCSPQRFRRDMRQKRQEEKYALL